MKKLLCLILVLLLTLSVTGCSLFPVDVDNGPGTETGTPSAPGNGTDSGTEGGGEDDGKTPSDPSTFSINHTYLGYMGLTKAEIDEKCGNEGTYYGEFGETDYGNGISVGYNRIGNDEKPLKTDVCMAMYIQLDKMFYNCPDRVTADQLKALFPQHYEQYDEYYGEKTLTVNYKGRYIVFNLETGAGKTDYAFYKDEPYPYDGSNPYAIDNRLGSYGTDEWVDGSYLNITTKNGSYYIELLMVRGVSFESYEYRMKNDREMHVITEFSEPVVLKWSEDYKNVTVHCADKNWQYMSTDRAVNFYKK